MCILFDDVLYVFRSKELMQEAAEVLDYDFVDFCRMMDSYENDGVVHNVL